MEAAGAPRLDAERRELVCRSMRGTGQRGLAQQDKSGLMLSAYAVGPAEEQSAHLQVAPSGDLRARDAGTLSFPSGPSWNTDQGV
jgi:hypothetical protein